MITLFSKLHDAIKKEADALGMVKRHTINKKDFVDNLKMLLQRYETIGSGILSLPASDRQVMADKIYSHKNDSKCQGCAAYIIISSECKTVNDTKVAFDSIGNVSKAVENVLANFQANVDILFEGSTDVNIHTAKLSHLALFGFVESAEMYAEYVINLLSIVTYEIIENNGTRELETPLPYKYKYLDDHVHEFIAFHRSMLNGGNKTYLDTFKSLKKSMDDIRVANSTTGSNIDMVDDGKMMAYSRGLFGQFSLNPFKWLGEQWNLIRNNKYMKIRSEREAILAHVSLLQLDAAKADPNSPEYAKLVKVIDSYNKLIGKMNQKLAKYYGPEEQL